MATATLPAQAPPSRRSRLEALTGMRALAALNILFFHFSDPKIFGPFAPVVDNGYVSVSFFLLLSGFVLAYNYRERADRGLMRARTFWKARFSRIYPVYLFSLLMSVIVLTQEWRLRPHGEFTWGVVLTLLLAQGWSPTRTFPSSSTSSGRKLWNRRMSRCGTWTKRKATPSPA